MVQRHKNASLRATSISISKIVTPLVLIIGLLFFATRDFTHVLAVTQRQDDQFQQLFAFHQGPFASTFKHSAGMDRPALLYYHDNLLSYAEWSSTITVDGNQQELWNSSHTYRVDEKNQTVYNIMRGIDWQLTEKIVVLQHQSIRVDFSFVAQPAPATSETHFVFDIVHTHDFWYNQLINGQTFTGQVMLGDPETLQRTEAKYRPILLGTLSLTVQSQLPQAPRLLVPTNNAVIGATHSWQWTRSLITEYTIDHPTPAQTIPLGSETITFAPNNYPSANLSSANVQTQM